MANTADDALLKALQDYRDRVTVQVETIASDARQNGTFLAASLQGRQQFTVPVLDSSVSRSSGTIG
ncbi:MAG: hypothetical protein KME45_03355 [Stenomitos rutilans HA7619-LM2]|jgi:hypothetical protein|nr:hypothetical protein [Stenomitos rutilans HA7619-LM2]MBW4469422.1 hypothetical protein [Stenomitos rutilans HA7619-LM2]